MLSNLRFKAIIKALLNSPAKAALMTWFGSVLITYVMMQVFLGEILLVGLLIATVCSLGLGYPLAKGVTLMRERIEDQNAELDAYAHTVAHDIKNPLSIVVSYSALLLDMEPVQTNADLHQQVTELATHAHKAIEIVEDLLVLASVRGEQIETASLDMPAIIEQAWGRNQHLIATFQAELHLPEHWHQAQGYAPWVEAIWANYLSNAIKYGGRPPIVTVESKTLSTGYVRFSVTDNGTGLSPEKQAQLFNQFSRLQRVQGYGLGLSIVQRIATRLGGTVGMESSEGKGSTFFFTLPQA